MRSGVVAFTAFSVYLSSCQRAAEDGFAADFGSVSGDGRSLRCSTVGEFSHDCDWVSVRAVQEKCDEIRVWELPLGTVMLGVGSSAGPPSAIPLGFARGFGKTGQAFSRSARRGAPPVISCQRSKTPEL